MEMPEALKITIITVCKNSEMFLQETIQSVISQTYKNIQYIVVDGLSTDGTLGIIKQHASFINRWISEADNGMYDAINKGLKLATGDYILILNSDDVLAANNTIKQVADIISKQRLDYYHGDMIKSKQGLHKLVKLFKVSFKELLLSTHCTFAPHPCFFISAKLNQALGGYNAEFKYASDYDYILRALAAPGSKGAHIGVAVTRFRLHENSITASGKIDSERKKILLEHGYFKQPYLSRRFFYYKLWIYYKMINLGQHFKAV